VSKHRVVIADNHAFYRPALAKMLTESGVDVVGEAGNGWAALRAVDRTAPDVVVLDLKMPGLSGAEVTRRLTSCSPPHRVLVLAVSASEDDVTSALRAGATGYFLKDGPVEDVVAGIGAAARGESLFSPRIGAMLLRRIRAREGGLGEVPVSLSQREQEALRLVVEGRSNEKIGEMRPIDSGTARTPSSRIGVSNRLRAAMRAVRRVLV
jgi:DNA-binding NarL/FixJ family response regulator